MEEDEEDEEDEDDEGDEEEEDEAEEDDDDDDVADHYGADVTLQYLWSGWRRRWPWNFISWIGGLLGLR